MTEQESSQPKSFNQGDVEFNLVDDEYITKMVGFETDCAAGGGEPMACHNTGEFFGVVKNDHNRASEIFKRNCNERDFGPSCFNLAKLYLGGKGVPEDNNKAELNFGKACQWGHVPACYHQGIMLYSLAMDAIKNNDMKPTSITSSNLEKGKQLLGKSCEAGLGDACDAIASHYLKSGLNDDKSKAKPYLTIGCDKANNVKSCHDLAVMYNLEKDETNYELYKQKTLDIVKLQGSKILKKKG